MKKKMFFAMLLTFVFIVSSAAIALANDIRVQLDGEYVDLYPVPIIVEGRTLLPARAIVEMLGGEVDWDGELRQVHIYHHGTHVLLTIDNPVAYVNGDAITLDVSPQLVGSFTKVPLRFVAESLGLGVDFYDGTVIITTDVTIHVTARDITLSDGTNQTVMFTPVVRRGDFAEVFFRGEPNAVWYLSIRYATGYGTAVGLGEQTADEDGLVEWRWRIGSNTTLGDWPVTISGNNESMRFEITIVDAN